MYYKGVFVVVYSKLHLNTEMHIAPSKPRYLLSVIFVSAMV